MFEFFNSAVTSRDRVFVDCHPFAIVARCAPEQICSLIVAGSEWLFKNKQHGMLSAAASVGMLLLWDVENGFSSIDKYSLSTHVWIKAGADMANGMLFLWCCVLDL